MCAMCSGNYCPISHESVFFFRLGIAFFFIIIGKRLYSQHLYIVCEANGTVIRSGCILYDLYRYSFAGKAEIKHLEINVAVISK